MSVGDVERAALDALARIFERTDVWLQRRPAEKEVQAGSRTAADDAATTPFQVSHFAELTLSSAVDHLHCLRTAMAEGQTLHMAAPFTLMRAAMENAAAAVWVLSAADQRDRVLRRLHFALDDSRDAVAVMTLTDDPIVPTPQDRIDRVAQVGVAAGLGRDVLLGRSASWTRIVESAGSHSPLGARNALVVWRLCSGFAHGRPWAWLSALDQQSIGFDGDVHLLNMTAPPTTVLLAAQAAAAMLEAGYGLQDRHRLAWRTTTRSC